MRKRTQPGRAGTGQALTPTRLAAALACGLLMLASPAGHGAVSLSGPYWIDPLGMPPLGPGDVDLPGATLYVGQGAPGSFAVLAGSQVALARLNLGGRGEATAVFDGAGTRVELRGTGDAGRLEVGHNAAKGSLTVSGGALLDGRADAAACRLGPRYCYAAIGNSAGSEALLRVSGAGSRASFLGQFLVGGIHVDTPVNFGNPGASTTGRLEVLAGGLLETEHVNAGVSHLSPWALGTERSQALLRVEGPGSTWRVTGNTIDDQGDAFLNLAVGPRATAQAELLDGGRLVLQGGAGRSYDLRVGNGGEATLSVAGAGSLLRLEGDADRGTLHVAEGGGSGVLSVREGGLLSSTARWVTVGERGGNGRLSVSGAGSLASFASGSGLSLGDAGTGRLEVQAGAALATGQLNLGRQAGGSGSVVLDGAGSRLTLDGTNMERLYIGNGELLVAGGALLDARVNAAACDGGIWCGNQVGAHAGARGSLTVTGAGSTARFLGSFQVGIGALGVQALDGYTQGVPGEAAVGLLKILDGGLVQADRISAGLGTYSLGATGTESVQADLRISGPGSMLQLTGGDQASAIFQTSIWNARNALVNVAITDGGRLQMHVPGDLSALISLSSAGGVTDFRVSGAGSAVSLSSANRSSVTLGGPGGMASMSFSAGARLDGVNALTIGHHTALARLSFDGPGTQGWLTGDAVLEIGARDSVGTLSISNGASLGTDAASTGVSVRVGLGSGTLRGSGTLSISGAGSALELGAAASGALSNPALIVGDRADGTLRISGGGRLSLFGGAVSTPQATRHTQLNIGGNVSGGNGALSVTGAGSSLAVRGQDAVIWVGNGSTGIGQMQVLDGARVDSTLLHLGNIGGSGALRLDAAEIHLDGQWSSADFGAALVLGKGVGSVGTAQLGRGARLLISNPGSAGAELSLGGTPLQPRGTGVLNLSGGSQIRLVAGAGLATASIGHSGMGSATLEGGSRLDVGDGSLYVGRLATAVGTLVLAGNSNVNAAYVGVGSTRSGDGGVGTLIVNDSVLAAPLIEIGARGYVGGNGTLVGQVVNRGVFSPGNSPGTLVIDGSFSNAAGGRLVLEIEADGQGGFRTDRLVFGDTSLIDLGSLAISFRFLGQTDPRAFQAQGGFDIDSFFALQSGAPLDHAKFAAVSYSASAAAYEIHDFSFSADGGARFSATPVPEPGSWLLMGLGLATLAGLRRRRPAIAAGRAAPLSA